MLPLLHGHCVCQAETAAYHVAVKYWQILSCLQVNARLQKMKPLAPGSWRAATLASLCSGLLCIWARDVRGLLVQRCHFSASSTCRTLPLLSVIYMPYPAPQGLPNPPIPPHGAPLPEIIAALGPEQNDPTQLIHRMSADETGSHGASKPARCWAETEGHHALMRRGAPMM